MYCACSFYMIMLFLRRAPTVMRCVGFFVGRTCILFPRKARSASPRNMSPPLRSLCFVCMFLIVLAAVRSRIGFLAHLISVLRVCWDRTSVCHAMQNCRSVILRSIVVLFGLAYLSGVVVFAIALVSLVGFSACVSRSYRWYSDICVFLSSGIIGYTCRSYRRMFVLGLRQLVSAPSCSR